MAVAKVRLSALGPARVRGRVAAMPVDGGQMEGPPAQGVAIPLGGLTLRSGKRAVSLRKLGIDITHGELGALIGGERRVVATFHGVRIVRDGFDAALTMRSLRLTGGAATILNRELEQPRLFRAGRRFAAMALNLEMRTLKAHAGEISLALGDAFRAKLESREVAVSPFALAPVAASAASASASASAIAPTLGLPISYGAIAPGLSQGSVGSTTGLRLTVGDGPVYFRDLFLVPLEINLDARAVNAWVSLVSSNKSMEKTAVATVDFTGSTLTPDQAAGTVSASAVTMSLSSAGAALFNEAFAASPKDSLFNTGEPVGTIGFILHG